MTCFELRRYRVANFTSSIEFDSESDPFVKNRIELQWGSKLSGTSSEALAPPTHQVLALCALSFPRNPNKQTNKQTEN